MKPSTNFEPGDVYILLNKVMADVGAVRKDQKNQAQGFKFRGIDDVVNAVYPALVKHGLVIFPSVLEHDYETVTVGAKGTQMGRVSMLVAYRIFAPDGSSVSGEVRAEAMDTGDKATAKCMSVAYRTFLLQTLCLPTDEPDPDHDVYERGPKQTAAPARTPSQTKNEPFQKAAPANTNSLNKAQRAFIEKQTAEHIGGTLVAVSDILGRTITTLDEVNQDEFRPILMALTPKEDN